MHFVISKDQENHKPKNFIKDVSTWYSCSDKLATLERTVQQPQVSQYLCREYKWSLSKFKILQSYCWSYLKQCNKKKKCISSSSELGIKEPWQECDYVVLCSAEKKRQKTYAITTVQKNSSNVLFPSQLYKLSNKTVCFLILNW